MTRVPKHDGQDEQKDDILVLRHIVRTGISGNGPDNYPNIYPDDARDGSSLNRGKRSDPAAKFPVDARCSDKLEPFADSADDDEEAAYMLAMRDCAGFEPSIEESTAAIAEKLKTGIFPGDSQDTDAEIPFISIHVPDPEPFEPKTKPPLSKRIFGKKQEPATKKRTFGPATDKPGLARREKLSLPKGRGFIFMLIVAGAAFYVLSGGKSCQKPSQTVPVSSGEFQRRSDGAVNSWKGRTDDGSSAPEETGPAAEPETKLN